MLSPALMDAHVGVRARLKSLVQTPMHAHLLAKATAEKNSFEIYLLRKKTQLLFEV